MWSIKHEPKSLEHFIGKKSVECARSAASKHLLVHGPIGTGKSLLTKLLANEKGLDIFEITGENIKEAQAISNTTGLFGNKRVLLIEDIENFGDLKSLGKIIDEGFSPVYATCTDFSSQRIKTVKKKFEAIPLRRALPSSISKHLMGILELEGIDAPKELVDSIAKSCQGDIRVAITNLEMVVAVSGELKEEDINRLLSDRDKKGDIYKALSVIFGSRDFQKVISSTWSLDEQPKDILWWIDENTPRLYQDRQAMAKAYAGLSRADIFLGRIMRRQTWGYLRYVNVLMTAGVNCARPEKINFTQYMFPGYFMAMSRTKSQRKIEDEISSLLTTKLHCSKRVIKSEYIPLMKTLVKSDKWTKEGLSEEFNLSDEHIEYMLGD